MRNPKKFPVYAKDGSLVGELSLNEIKILVTLVKSDPFRKGGKTAVKLLEDVPSDKLVKLFDEVRHAAKYQHKSSWLTLYEDAARVRRNSPPAKSRKRGPEGRFLADNEWSPDLGDDYGEEANVWFTDDPDEDFLFEELREEVLFPSDLKGVKKKNKKGRK